MKGIRHTGIVVSDLDRSMHFYGDLLGLKVEKDNLESGEYINSALSMKNVKVRTVKMSADDGNCVELLFFHSPPHERSEARKANEIGITHIAFAVNGIDALYKMLKTEGVIFIAPPKRSPDGYAKVSFCYDPDGNLLELVEVLEQNEK